MVYNKFQTKSRHYRNSKILEFKNEYLDNSFSSATDGANYEILGDTLGSESILVLPFPLFESKVVAKDQPFSFPVLAFDQTGWRFDLEIFTQLVYTYNGEEFNYGSPLSGYYPEFNIDKKESYYLTFGDTKVGANVQFPRVNLNVYK